MALGAQKTGLCNWPAFMQVQSLRWLAGAAGRRSQVPALPQAPRRRVWPRAPAQRGRKRALGAGTSGRSERRGGCKRDSSLSCSTERNVLNRTYIALRGVDEGVGAQLGCFGGRKHMLSKSLFELSLRELHWSRRRKGRTLLRRGRGVLQYLSGSSLLPPIF